MHKASVVLVLVMLVIQCFGQQSGHETVTISGCLMNTNGRFKLLTQGQTYVLKGHQNELFSYNGMLVEVAGTVETDPWVLLNPRVLGLRLLAYRDVRLRVFPAGDDVICMLLGYAA